MKRLQLLGLVVLVLVAAVRSGLAAGPEISGRPNIVFLFADDQRPDTIRAWGNPHIDTPSLDSLAAQGFSFRRNYCMGSIHGAVCQPSRAMLMSGRSLYRVPMNLDGVPILPELLRERGYTTYGIGKWHNGEASFVRGFGGGKSILFGGMSNHLEVPVRDLEDDGKLTPKRTATAFSSELFADAAVEFLRGRRGRSQPFFLYVAFTAPHDPRQPPEPYRQKYYDSRPPLPVNYRPQHPFDNGWMTGRDEKLAPWPRTRKVIADQVAEYYGMIEHLDAQIGRVLEALKASGHGENTWIVYAADHGLAVGSHGLLGKQNLYEHSVGCPLIIVGPGVPKSATSDALTYLFDLFPTLCEVTGTPLPARIDGSSLRPIWSGQVETIRPVLFTTYENKMRAVRDARWKLIRYPLIDRTQLFDLTTDPHEIADLSQDPECAEEVTRLWKVLQERQKAYDDPHPLAVEDAKTDRFDFTGRPRLPDRWQPRWIVDKYFEPLPLKSIVESLSRQLRHDVGLLGAFLADEISCDGGLLPPARDLHAPRSRRVERRELVAAYRKLSERRREEWSRFVAEARATLTVASNEDEPFEGVRPGDHLYRLEAEKLRIIFAFREVGSRYRVVAHYADD